MDSMQEIRKISREELKAIASRDGVGNRIRSARARLRRNKSNFFNAIDITDFKDRSSIFFK